MLPQRIPQDELLELADHVGVAAEREIGVDPSFENDGACFAQAGDLRLREFSVGHVRKWVAAPQPQRIVEQCSGRASDRRVVALRVPARRARRTGERR